MRVEQEKKKREKKEEKQKKAEQKVRMKRGLEKPIVTVYSLLDKC